LLEKLNLSVVNCIEDAEGEVEKRKGLEAARSNVAAVDATPLVKLFRLYARGLQTLCRE